VTLDKQVMMPSRHESPGTTANQVRLRKGNSSALGYSHADEELITGAHTPRAAASGR
jgi:hypothetical protein